MTNRWENSLKVPYTFLMTFLLGWAGYSLKLVSILKLIEGLSISYLPAMMIVQGFFLYFSLKLVQKFRLKFPKSNFLFFYSILALVVFCAGHPFVTDLVEAHGLKILFNSGLFLFSFLGISVSEILIKDIQAKNLSVLKNPHQAGQLTLALEVGIIFAAAGTLMTNGESVSLMVASWNSTPFILSLGFFIIFSFFKQDANVESNRAISVVTESKVNPFYYPFIPYLLAVVTLILVSKNIQGYASLLGMIEWKKSGGGTMAIIFSKFNIVQTLIILASLVPSFFKQKSNPNWAMGLNVYFIIQACSMAVLCIYSPAFILVGTGIFRKVIQHSLVLKSMQQLESSIPSEVRAQIKILQESFGQGVAFVVSGLLLALTLNGPVPELVVWGFGLVFAVVGVVYRKKLLTTLNEFQVANIVKTDVFQAISALHGLANKESSKHYMALVNLLENNPRPILAKALIYSLGKMEKENAIPYIISYYKKHDREDVHLEIINSLCTFQSHKINLFLSKCLQDIILKQTSLGELRVSVFKILSTRIKDIALLTLMDILEENKNNPPVLANAIILLGEMAVENNDHELFKILSEFLSSNYPRRVRVNAILYLYHSRDHSQSSLEALDTFLTSSDQFDRTSVAFVAGNLQLKGLLPFIIKSSEELKHSNSTLLVSLLKLGYKKAATLFAELIMNAEEKECLTALNQFNTISSAQMRYLVYDALILNYPNDLKRFNAMLRKTQRNFDLDRQVINAEAKRLGLEIEENKTIYSIDPVISLTVSEKKAA
jgi:HEAT repeat protein